MKSTHNTGENVYFDSGGIKRNLRSMIQMEPEWVHSTYQHMKKELIKLKAENERLTAEVQALLHNPPGQYLT